MPVSTSITGTGARRWRSCGRHLPTRRFLSVYVGVVVALTIASSFTQDSVGPALYLLAGFLTLPTGVLIYPALFVNLFLTGLITTALGFGFGAEDVVREVGVTVIFAGAAFANSVLVRLVWNSIRRINDSTGSPFGDM